jgi:hypothetical protein
MLPERDQETVRALIVEQASMPHAETVDIDRINDFDERAREALSRAVALLPAPTPGSSGPQARVRACLSTSLQTRPW